MEKDSKQLEAEIRELIAQILEKDPSAIKPDTRFVEGLGMDSMMALEILVAIEKKYQIKIPEDKLAKIITVNDVLEFLKEYVD